MRVPSRTTALVAAVAVQAGLVVVAVAPRLSARLLGDTYAVRVEPLDPIDPFRGAYVTLRYTDFRTENVSSGGDGTVYVPLVPDGALWRAGAVVRERPASGPFVKCRFTGSLNCGIESLFLPQDKAKALERDLSQGGVARLKVDGRGNASVLDVRAG